MRTPYPFATRYLPFASTFIVTFFTCLPFSPAQAQSLPNTLVLTTDHDTLTLNQSDLATWITLAPTLHYDADRLSEIEDTSWCVTEQSYCDFFLPRRIRFHAVVTFHKSIEETAFQDFITQTAKEFEETPVNAVLGIQDNTMIVKQAEQKGFQVDRVKTAETVRHALLSSHTESVTIAIPGVVIDPAIKGSDIERLGIKELVAEGTTNFAGSPKNRVFNIMRALQQFQGIIIAPGEEFSFVKYLGTVDGESGYLPELVIKNNRTEPEFGGGICQVSSTVFRTAIYGGLKITARRNHAYPVSYYRPYGMDATIYIPNPDLKFINNTPGSLFLQSTVTGTQLTFQMYGTNDGRKIAVDGPHILESNPDGSMRTVFTQEVSDASGQNIIRDTFRSNYKSPSLFPHPGDEVLTTKPADWSQKEWGVYQRTHAR